MTNPDIKAAKFLNKNILRCLKDPSRGLNFIALDRKSLRVSVFVDAGFASNNDCSSQIGFVMVLMDSFGSANIIHYGSLKCKRIVRSVLAAELLAMMHGFDISSTIRLAVNCIMDRKVSLELYTDSRSLYDCLVSINTTSEKRLLIDLSLLRECYERREISQVLWIPTHQNPADGFTKAKPNTALDTLILDNKLHLTPNAWIDRPEAPPTWA